MEIKTRQDSVWEGTVISIKCYLTLNRVDARARNFRITVSDLIKSTFKRTLKKNFGNAIRMTSKRQRKFSR